MNIHYQIVNFDRNTGSVDVQYYSYEIDITATIRIDLPIIDGAFPSSENLDSLINSYTPTYIFERTVANVKTIDATHIIDAICPIYSPTVSTQMPSAISVAKDRIDFVAGGVRARFITVAPGQEVTYMMKAQAADEYAAVGFTGTPSPYIALEAEHTSQTAQQVAEGIIATRNLWNEVLNPQIESIRIGGKQQVENTTTPEELQTTLSEIIATLQSIGA